MLVGDQDSVEVADVLEAGHGARVEEQPRAVGLDEETGVAEVGELHRSPRVRDRDNDAILSL